MPTATTTVTGVVYSPKAPLKAAMKSMVLSAKPTTSSTASTLRSLYNRATRAFLHRDIGLTHSLIETAFQLLESPTLVHDALAEHPRRWDILRITLETTIYADPPAMDGIPQSLRSNLTESPHTLMSNIYKRSLELFTPTEGALEKITPNPAYLPADVLITLLYSTLKVDCPEIGRMMSEQWISRKEAPLLLNSTSLAEDSKEAGYGKVVEIYALNILPKLEQWEYAKEFLQFEGQLPEDKKESLRSQLNALHAETLAARTPRSLSQSPSSTPTPRAHSPTPSSSSSSSLSTTSTHTVVPATPRGNRSFAAPPTMTTLPPAPESPKPSSDGTETPTLRGRQTNFPHRNALSHSQTRRANSSATSSSSALSSGPRTNIQTSSISTSSPTLLSIIKNSLAPHLTTSKVTTFMLLFVLVPLLSWALRIRHRRRKVAAAVMTPSNVDLVRRRLQVASASDANIVTRLWRESLRAVVDTVKMAGSGLV